MSAEELAEVAAELLAPLGFGSVRRFEPLAGGANNRVFRVDADHGTALLKSYFQHTLDARDRLGAEFAFLHFAWESGIREVPRPLVCDRGRNLGLYEYVPAQPPRAVDINDEAVDQAIAFYRALQTRRECEIGRALPQASEACFCLGEHLDCVQRRVVRLEGCAGDSTLDREAKAFICRDLTRIWQSVAKTFRQQAGQLGLEYGTPLVESDRCVSPSDFGFHNALVMEDGRFCFVDFEYAGWDDPAKLICDFICQPALPVPARYYERFAASVCAGLTDPDWHQRRAAFLLPVYRVKWCCILLNEFLPVAGSRRHFASSGTDSGERKARQLQKARHALERFQDSPGA